MRRVLLLLLIAAIGACSNRPPKDVAGQHALSFYQALVDGRYDDFTAGIDGFSQLPADYCEQLVLNARQFVGRMEREHRGVRSVRLMNSKSDSLSAEAFLVLCFGDSTNEEIVVPMVMRDGQWLMK